MSAPELSTGFDRLALSAPLLQAVAAQGYTTPSPIQARCIPLLLAGHDLLGQAQTGTGKTAAFALPALMRVDLGRRAPQVLVLTPTRELALQVAAAFEAYAGGLNGLRVLPVYGGQGMALQLRELKRGPHIVVGTPGRIMDHLRRASLSLAAVHTLVLDEADEMLNMGFIEDVEWILEQSPPQRQLALFSATLPEAVRRIARRHMPQAEEVTVAAKTATVAAIDQRYWLAAGVAKADALCRILEAEAPDAMLVFVRTKAATVELAEQLEARGFAVAALNGDMSQPLRERTVEKLKSGELNIVVATDVAARGLDVERISHVLNYDIPEDPETYIHRIGRTGRAGRSGVATVFVAPREKRLLRAIERTTGQTLKRIDLPSGAAIAAQRIARFKQQLDEILGSTDLSVYREVAAAYAREKGVDVLDIAAALSFLAQRERPFQVAELPAPQAGTGERKGKRERKPARNDRHKANVPMVSYRLEVGRDHQVQTRDIVGAIANEAGLDGEYIGRIRMFEEHSTVDLPAGMPKEIFSVLQRTWVRNRQLRISRLGFDNGHKARRGKKAA